MSEKDIYADGEIIGADVNGHLICWDDHRQEAYNCGETLEEFGGAHLLTNRELRALGLPEVENNPLPDGMATCEKD